MGVYYSSYQIEERYFEKFLPLLKEQNSIWEKEIPSVEKQGEILEENWKMLSNVSLSVITNKIFINDILLMLLLGNKDCSNKHDTNSIAYLPFYGSKQFEFLEWIVGWQGILKIDEIRSIVSLLQELNFITRTGFENYYALLPKDFKEELFASWM